VGTFGLILLSGCGLLTRRQSLPGRPRARCCSSDNQTASRRTVSRRAALSEATTTTAGRSSSRGRPQSSGSRQHRLAMSLPVPVQQKGTLRVGLRPENLDPSRGLNGRHHGLQPGSKAGGSLLTSGSACGRPLWVNSRADRQEALPSVQHKTRRRAGYGGRNCYGEATGCIGTRARGWWTLTTFNTTGILSKHSVPAGGDDRPGH